MTTKNRLAMCAASALALCLAGGAMATPTFTTVNNPPSGEASHQQIFTQIYGGVWSKASNGRDYSNGRFSAMRLADAGVPTPTSLTTGVSGTDNAWVGPSLTSVIAQAKYAADNSVFGFYDDTGSDHSFHQIFNTSSLNHAATINMPAQFRWAIRDLSTGRIFTSRSSDNVDAGSSCNQSFDQLVTYKVMDCNTGLCQWALFWEDRIRSQHSDYDFNDSVITVQACNIPAPAGAVVLGLAGLGVGFRRRK